MGVQRVHIEPDVGIPDLIRRLGEDSKRLMTDEVQLAKLETQDAIRQGSRGAMWLGMALATGVVTAVAFTLFVATLIGRLVAGHMWLGAIVAAVIDLALGAVFVKRGLAAFTKPSYSLEETRASLH